MSGIPHHTAVPKFPGPRSFFTALTIVIGVATLFAIIYAMGGSTAVFLTIATITVIALMFIFAFLIAVITENWK